MNSRKQKLHRKTIASITGLIVILLSFSILLLYRQYTWQEHCVTSISPEDQEPLGEPSPDKCFNTQAEALSYISDGRIVLPENASQEEIDAAINQYNSEMAALEAGSNE